jgi:hypothetical protein
LRCEKFSAKGRKQATIADRCVLNRVTEIACEFIVNWSSVKNSQALDWESETGALRQLNLPEIDYAEGDSLQI